MPQAWEMALSELTGNQIKAGLVNLQKYWGDSFPPNCNQMVNLCKGYHVAKDGTKTRLEGVRLDPTQDPNHPNYIPPKQGNLLEDKGYQERNQAKNKETMAGIKNLFESTSCEYCMAEGAEYFEVGRPFCNMKCANSFHDQKIDAKRKDLK